MRIYCAGVLLAGAVFGQTFEAADVHASAPERNQFARGGRVRGAQFDLRNASMVDLVARAYGVDEDLVFGGPSWLEMDRFDIIAKTPADGTQDDVKIMLRALLADRFKLAVHNDTKSVPAYALKAGKHPALKKADGSGDKGCQFVAPGRGGGPVMVGPSGVQTFSYSCHNMTMEAFTEAMRTMIFVNQILGGEKVVNQTGLEGTWDFNFKYTPPAALMFAMGEPIPLFDAVEKQLGLKLEPVNVPMAVVVVDSVNRKPTDNAPDLAEQLRIAPLPTEFEVADVKPSNPGSNAFRTQIQPGGRVNMSGVTLRFLIQQAWNLTPDMLAGAPKWLDEDRYDIVAKAPESAAAIDMNSMWQMVRSLLMERFKLKTHIEDRPVPAYTLVAVKPRLKAADPASRTRFKEVSPGEGKDPLSRHFIGQNLTMAQFANQLQRVEPGFIHVPVLDATEVEGAWDFTLTFRAGSMGRGRGGRGEDASAVVPSASDPSGGVTLFEAIEKLGLKLQTQKRTIPVLVIDHMEQKPTEN